MRRIRNIGVILRPNMPSLAAYYHEIKAIFKHYNLTTILESSSAEMIQESEGLTFEELLHCVDLLLAVGGDGTLLALIRRSYGSQIPVMGVNMGRMGFLAEIYRNEVSLLCECLVNGEYSIQEALMLEGELHWHGKYPLLVDTIGVHYGKTACVHSIDEKIIHFFAFNEFTLMRSDTFGMIYPQISIVTEQDECKPFNSYGGDGLLISTPHGSTAYNISAGGPILYPFSENIILTPICAHSLTQCPLVLSSDLVLCLELLEPSAASLLIDGQRRTKFEFGSRLFVRKATQSALLLYTKHYDYFKILREKFRWG